MTTHADPAVGRHGDEAAAGEPLLGALVAGAPSCRVVQLLEDWHRRTRTHAQRMAEELRRR